ncbi:thioredoxin domain-containing protein [Vibrio vulnificus]|nr:thioredoxin domain-containing protein [Vibrio vulnificus]
MKKTILTILTVSTLAGCASTVDNQALEAKIQQLEINQRLIAARLQMTSSVMPKEIEFMDGIQIGQVDAPYVVIEFTDLQCPYCSTFQQETFPEFKKNHIDTGKVLYVAREFPLKSIHPNATEAAVALRCSYQQQPQSYSSIKSDIFTNRDKLNHDFYQSIVAQYELNHELFQSCMNSTDAVHSVDEAYKYAFGIGLNSTPSFIFGKNTGKSVIEYRIAKGALTLENMEKALETVK